jgi:hypothetical protein
MTFFGGPMGMAENRGASLGGSFNRTNILGRQYQSFANPFFDQASTYTPQTVRSLFGFCRYYFLTHGVINAICTKAAEYPITDIIFTHKDRGVVDRWRNLMLGDLNYRMHQFEVNLDYYVYGNALVSPSFPFRKMIICGPCNARIDAINFRRHWRYTDHRFYLTCPKCGQSDFAQATDDYQPKPSEINMVRWNPENVSIFHNETTGRMDYALDLSGKFRSLVAMGRKDIIATTPQLFLQAVKEKRSLVFDKREVFHMRRPALSSMDQGWGVPLLMPVMKDAFYMQLMKKSQETVLLTHMVPQIFLYPQPATSGADPFSTINLADWRGHIQRELARQRVDPSYYGILPFPLGHQIIGENGKALLLMQEIRMIAELIAIGMGFPSDLVFGQGTYAGTSVSMRMVENFFLSNVQNHYRLIHWFMGRTSHYLNWSVPTARFKPFKMADDLQRMALAASLNQQSKISDTSLLAMMDFNVEDESSLQVKETQIRAEALKKQQLIQAEIQGEAMVVQARYQAQAQEIMAEAQLKLQQKGLLPLPMDPNNPGAAAGAAGGGMGTAPSTPFTDEMGSGLAAAPTGIPLDQVAAGLANQISAQPREMQSQSIDHLAQTQPELAELVKQHIVGQSAAPDTGGVDMRPMPNQKPPRRLSLGGAGG